MNQTQKELAFVKQKGNNTVVRFLKDDEAVAYQNYMEKTFGFRPMPYERLICNPDTGQYGMYFTLTPDHINVIKNKLKISGNFQALDIALMSVDRAFNQKDASFTRARNLEVTKRRPTLSAQTVEIYKEKVRAFGLKDDKQETEDTNRHEL